MVQGLALVMGLGLLARLVVSVASGWVLASGLAIFDDLLHPVEVGGSNLVDHVTPLVPLHDHGQLVLLPGLDVDGLEEQPNPGEDDGHHLVDQGLPLVPLHDPGQLALLPGPDDGLEELLHPGEIGGHSLADHVPPLVPLQLPTTTCDKHWNRLLQLWNETDALVVRLIAHTKECPTELFQAAGNEDRKIRKEWKEISDAEHKCDKERCKSETEELSKIILKNMEKTLQGVPPEVSQKTSNNPTTRTNKQPNTQVCQSVCQ